MAHEGHPGQVLGTRGELSTRGEELLQAYLLDLLLRRAEALEDVADPLGQLLGPDLEGLS